MEKIDNSTLVSIRNKFINRDLDVSVWKETYVINNIIELLNLIEGWTLGIHESDEWLSFSLKLNYSEAKRSQNLVDMLMDL